MLCLVFKIRTFIFWESSPVNSGDPCGYPYVNCNVLRTKGHLIMICLWFEFKLCGRPWRAPVGFIKNNHISKGILEVIFNIFSQRERFYFLYAQKTLWRLEKKFSAERVRSCCCPRYWQTGCVGFSWNCDHHEINHTQDHTCKSAFQMTHT